MPYFGLLPFLRRWQEMEESMPNKCFNALLRASSFSTQLDNQIMLVCNNVSMPYFGLLPFLRWQKWRELCQISMFQCPTSGFFLFYSKYAGSGACKQICFNALLRASSFSTRQYSPQAQAQAECFNALLRASSFSTLY